MYTFCRKLVPLRCRPEGRNPQMPFSTIYLRYPESSKTLFKQLAFIQLSKGYLFLSGLIFWLICTWIYIHIKYMHVPSLITYSPNYCKQNHDLTVKCFSLISSYHYNWASFSVILTDNINMTFNLNFTINMNYEHDKEYGYSLSVCDCTVSMLFITTVNREHIHYSFIIIYIAFL